MCVPARSSVSSSEQPALGEPSGTSDSLKKEGGTQDAESGSDLFFRFQLRVGHGSWKKSP